MTEAQLTWPKLSQNARKNIKNLYHYSKCKLKFYKLWPYFVFFFFVEIQTQICPFTKLRSIQPKSRLQILIQIWAKILYSMSVIQVNTKICTNMCKGSLLKIIVGPFRTWKKKGFQFRQAELYTCKTMSEEIYIILWQLISICVVHGLSICSFVMIGPI